MGLLESLGLPSKAPAEAADAAAVKEAPPLRATVILHNASESPLVLRGSRIGNSARFESKPPAKVAPNATATFRVVDPADIEATAGEVEYASEGSGDKAKVSFSWSGKAGEIRVEGNGRYATSSRFRQDAQAGREYLLLFKETGKIRGPIIDELDEDMEKVEAQIAQERSRPAPETAAAAEATKGIQSTRAADGTPGAPSADQAAPPPAADAPPAAAPPEFSGLCKVTIDNRTAVTLRRGDIHLDNKAAHFGVPPPQAIPAGRSMPFVVWSRDPLNPEIGGFVNYDFVADPAPEGNPGGEFRVNIAWSGSEAGANVQPPSKIFDVDKGGKPGAFVFTVTGPAIEFAPPPRQTSQPTLRQGDKSPDGWVEYLQQLLNLQNDAGLEVDGTFGGLTLKAVVAYQRKLKKKDPEVLDDGVVGDQTWSYLREGAPAKPATDKRKPHSYVEKGVEARWQTEKGSLVYHLDRDIATLFALSVGDADLLTGRTARFRITSPTKVQKVVEALIGAANKSSKSGQGNEHLVTVEAFSDLWGSGSRAPAGVYTVEAYFPGDLGGDTYSGSLTIEENNA